MNRVARTTGRRCGTAILQRVTPTLRAADHVAADFERGQRKLYLTQAIQREHDGVDEAVASDCAEVFITASEAGWNP